MSLVDTIDEILPQTQCGECGYTGCMPYAKALAAGEASIDKCPPGGEKTLQALAKILKLDPTLYLKTFKTRKPAVALIKEAECIGCTKCIKACPVDAIIGSAKLLHAIVTHECTGCGLCIEPCPVDCIEMTNLEHAQYNPDIARKRYNIKQQRILEIEATKQIKYKAKRNLVAEKTGSNQDILAKQDYILQALARVKAKKAHVK